MIPKQFLIFLTVCCGVLLTLAIPRAGISSEVSSSRGVPSEYHMLQAVDKTTYSKLLKLEKNLERKKNRLKDIEFKMSVERLSS